MAAEGDNFERTVSVSASGTVSAEPDIAYISAGVVTEGQTAKDAIARNNTVMAKVIEGLKGAGVAARDIQTNGIAVLHQRQRPSAIALRRNVQHAGSI